MMQTAVIIAVWNEEKNIAALLNSLLHQTHLPQEVILVDDGSTDKTRAIIEEFSKKNPLIYYLFQPNKGPAFARNLGWKNSHSELCIFTDGDCLPEPNWIETLLSSFKRGDIAAVAGSYKTLNPESRLAKFIGLEIEWRYRNVRGEVDVHGSYNLAVRRNVLEEVGGFREDYKRPSGEDWDLTCKISRRYKIIYEPAAIVGHYHPECVAAYLKNQAWRAYDRIKVYRDHPQKVASDTYTGNIAKYQVAATGLFLISLFLFPFISQGYWISLTFLTFLIGTLLKPFVYYFKKDPAVAFYSLGVQFLRFFAWAGGAVAGVFQFLIRRRP